MYEHVQKKETYHTVSPDLFLNRDHQGGIKTVWARQTDRLMPSIQESCGACRALLDLSSLPGPEQGPCSVSASLQRGPWETGCSGKEVLRQQE